MTTPAHQPASGERRRTAAAIKAQIIARAPDRKEAHR